MLRRSINVLFVLLSILLLAACGAGASTPAPTNDSSAQSQSASPTSAPVVAPTLAPEPTQAPAPTEAPANTPEPMIGGGAACLVGTWQFQDMSAYLSSVLSKSNGAVQFKGQEGTILYT